MSDNKQAPREVWLPMSAGNNPGKAYIAPNIASDFAVGRPGWRVHHYIRADVAAEQERARIVADLRGTYEALHIVELLDLADRYELGEHWK